MTINICTSSVKFGILNWVSSRIYSLTKPTLDFLKSKCINFVKLNIPLDTLQFFSYLKSVNKVSLAAGGLVIGFFFACTPCNKNPNPVC